MTQAPPPGTVLLGKYRVERELGSGGMGVVLEATHIALGQTVAIKLLNPELAQSPDIVTRFLREARIAATLPSEHVARVSDVGQTETGAPYIVMERLIGHDLEAELQRRGRLPVSYAVDLVLEACEGVAEAHARGLVHRDLKPANLFLAERPPRTPVIKVLDFGLTKEANGQNASLTGTEAVFGTPQYMSPEQILSTKNVDARSDQHALAMILYEALAGEPPFKAESVTQLIVVIATQPPPRVRVMRPDVPLGLEAAIVRALAKRAAERFPDLAAFAAAIAPFGGPEAKMRAELVARSLAYTAPPRAGSIPDAATTSTPADEALTLPALPPRAPALTNAGLTSSVDPLKGSRRNAKRGLALAIAAVAVGVLAIALIVGAQSKSAPEEGTKVGAIPAPAAPRPTEPVVTQGEAIAAPSATAAPPAAATSTKTSKAPREKAPKPSDKTLQTTVKTFGDKRK